LKTAQNSLRILSVWLLSG